MFAIKILVRELGVGVKRKVPLIGYHREYYYSIGSFSEAESLLFNNICPKVLRTSGMARFIII